MVMVVHVALVGARVVIMAAVCFVTVTKLVTWNIVMGRVGLVAAAVVQAGLVFVTLIVVLMVGCVLVMYRAMAIMDAGIVSMVLAVIVVMIVAAILIVAVRAVNIIGSLCH